MKTDVQNPVINIAKMTSRDILSTGREIIKCSFKLHNSFAAISTFLADGSNVKNKIA